MVEQEIQRIRYLKDERLENKRLKTEMIIMRTVSFSNPSVSPRTFMIETITSVARVDTLGCQYKAVSCK